MTLSAGSRSRRLTRRCSRRRGRCATRGTARSVSYSRKVFIPLTRLCRDVCAYCTFAHPPRLGEAALPLAGRGAGRRRAPARPPGAARRCSPWATSPSAPLPHRARRAGAARPRHHRRLPSPRCAPLVLARDRPAAPRQRRRDGRRGHRRPAEGHRLPRADAGEHVAATVRAGRLSHWGSPDKAPGRAAGDHRRAAGEQRVPFTLGAS